MRQRRRRAFDRGTGGDGQDSAGRVPAGIPGATAVRVRFTATSDGLSFAATVDGVSLTDGIDWVPFAVGIRVSDAAAFVGVSRAASAADSTTGVFTGVAAGAAAWVHRAAASRRVVRQLGEQRR